MAKIDFLAGDDAIVEGSLSSPEIVVDGYRGVQTNGQMVKVNFFSNRFDGEKHVVRKCAAFTLVTSIADFVAIAKAMNEAVADFERDGIITLVSSEEEQPK